MSHLFRVKNDEIIGRVTFLVRSMLRKVDEVIQAIVPKSWHCFLYIINDNPSYTLSLRTA